jgi:hypothetical protein
LLNRQTETVADLETIMAISRKYWTASTIVTFTLGGIGASPVCAAHRIDDAPPLRLVHTIPAPALTGRIDHLGYDSKRDRLFVCGSGANLLLVVDLKTNALLGGGGGADVPALNQPADVVYVPDLDVLAVACIGDGTCKILDAETYKVLRTVPNKISADIVRYDSKMRRLYLGYGEGALCAIDPATATVIFDTPLKSHPEGIAFEESGNRIFVNVPGAKHIAILNKSDGSILQTWKTQTDAEGNHPIALDEKHRRLFIGCRSPSRFLVLDSQTGAPVALMSIIALCDDLYYDADARRIYISCGMGTIDAFQQKTPDEYRLIAREPTSTGARTSFFVRHPQRGARLFVPIPQWEQSQKPEIRIYDLSPAAARSAINAQPDSSARSWNFDGEPVDQPLQGGGWRIEATKREHPDATWKVLADSTAPSPPNVLALTEITHKSESAFNICWNDQAKFKDGTIEVSFKANGGEADQGGGPIWRVKDKNNYYICRANPLERNFRVYYVKDGNRKQLASANVEVAREKWHTIKVHHVGDHIECWFNGQNLLHTHDSTLSEAGGVGVWTKADAATSFDDLKVTPSKP